MTNKTPAMILQELATKAGTIPVFNVIHQVEGTHENEFTYKVDILGVVALGRGRSKKEAKQESAIRALSILAAEGKYDMQNQIPTSAAFNKPNDSDDLRQVVNYIGLLGDVCLFYNIPVPEIKQISAVGPSHAMEFTMECHMATSMCTRATASTKRMAKQIVAREMLERIKNIAPIIAKEHDEQLRIGISDEDVGAIYKDLSIMKAHNLGLKIGDFNHSLRNRIKDKEIDNETLREYFKEPHAESKLATLLEMLELEWSWTINKEDYEFVVCALNINNESPLCTMSLGDTVDIAKSVALKQMFHMLNAFIYE